MQTFDPHHPLAIAVLFAFGAIIGSFLNVVIHRLPVMIEGHRLGYNLIKPPSACPVCKNRLSLRENIPLISFLIQQGRCAHCGSAISWRYPLVELLAALVAIIVGWRFGISITALAAFVFLGAAICIAFIDIENMLIPNAITYPMITAGLTVNLFGTFASFPDSVVGALGGYAFLWSIYWIIRLTIGKEAMGIGDFKLLAGIGAWLGWQALPLVLVAGCLVGSVVGGTMILSGIAKWGQPVPFGPYLAMGGAVAMIGEAYIWVLYWTYVFGG